MTLRFGEVVLIRVEFHQGTNHVAGEALGLRFGGGILARRRTQCNIVHPCPQVDYLGLSWRKVTLSATSRDCRNATMSRLLPKNKRNVVLSKFLALQLMPRW